MAVTVTACFLVLGYMVQAQQRTVNEGSKPYTPTRLEWLALEMESGSRVELSEASGYEMDFVSPRGSNTILIVVGYLPSVNREVMNISIASARKLIEMESTARGWSPWLKIEERVELMKTKDQH
jgi:hypothetical protein